MKNILSVVLSALLLSSTLSATAVDMGSVVKAQVILGQVGQVVDKYQEVQALLDAGTITLKSKEPIQGSSGKYMLPFDQAGEPTEWAAKALTAQAGAEVGAMASDQAVGMLAAKVPFGGFLKSSAKSKSKEMGAVLAIGGWDYVKENTSLSFDSMYDYSVYMHAKFQGLPGYEEALASAMAIYPKLEQSHKGSVDKAYKEAKSEAKRLAKAEKKRQKALAKEEQKRQKALAKAEKAAAG